MTTGTGEALRVALLYHQYDPSRLDGPGAHVRDLALCLRDAGHEPWIISSHRSRKQRSIENGIPMVCVRQLPEALLRARGFTGPLTPVIPAFWSLTRGRFDLSHAFSAPDMLPALLARRLWSRPAVFTCSEILDRSRLADTRLRLAMLAKATEDADALIASSQQARDSIWHWLALNAPVVAARDCAEHERIYRLTLARSQVSERATPQETRES